MNSKNVSMKPVDSIRWRGLTGVV